MNAQRAHELAAEWTGLYFRNRGFVPTAGHFRQIYDMALGHFLKQAA